MKATFFTCPFCDNFEPCFYIQQSSSLLGDIESMHMAFVKAAYRPTLQQPLIGEVVICIKSTARLSESQHFLQEPTLTSFFAITVARKVT
jgi:hypothetical protein